MLSEKIIERIRKEEQQYSAWQKIWSSIFQPKLIPALALGCIVTFGIFFILEMNNEASKPLEVDFAQFSDIELNHYIMANLEGFDNEIIETNYMR